MPIGSRHLPPDNVRPARSLAATPAAANAFVEEALGWLPDASAESFALTPPDAADSLDRAHAVDSRMRRPRIVLADDNADMRGYIARILETGGYDVHAVADGEAALAAIHQDPAPDLLLTDIMMPRLDGFGLLQAIRADPATSGLLVVLLSARAGEEARVEGLAAGADDYLVKPFAARELLARIDGAVRMAKLRRLCCTRA